MSLGYGKVGSIMGLCALAALLIIILQFRQQAGNSRCQRERKFTYPTDS